MALLEVCSYSLECAVTAQQAGADRIELCSAPKEGGLTPSVGLLKQTRARVSIPVHPIIRPRGGDFCYSDSELACMLDDIALVRELGFPGMVVGILNEEGEVNVSAMKKVMAASGDMAVTFHRAFDMCRDPRGALHTLGELGVARVLSSGQRQTAESGITLLTELNQQSGAPIIMAGAGVRLNNLQLFVDNGITELHSSAGRVEPSPMRFRQAGVSMSADPQADEFNRYRVDGAAVAAMKALLAKR